MRLHTPGERSLHRVEQSVSNTQVVPAQAGIQWSARDDWVPAYAGMTDKWEAHLLVLVGATQPSRLHPEPLPMSLYKMVTAIGPVSIRIRFIIKLGT